jgi:hypothetical protein
MIPYKVARIISVTLVCGAILFSVIMLSGCASQEERMKGNKEMAIIAYEFRAFAEECRLGDGRLMIDRPVDERRERSRDSMGNERCCLSIR